MTTDEDDSTGRDEAGQIAHKARRKQRAERAQSESPWFGLGLFGLVGWAVAVPTVAGIALGLWLDGRIASDTSWTLVCLFAGVALGCLNAWFWVQRESRGD
ncbi:MAG: AtpZ/AtpI family protein [Roseitalea porphyridii]|uniref:AtpZ/AtpI family protein n=1 Tax=Roseitalea porphyridii TaxID=1852022 RepID=UPI0032D949E0